MKSKAGRPKMANSIHTLGRVNIAVDRPCRDDLKELARVNRMTLVDYLRFIVNRERQDGNQTIMLGYDLPGKRRSPELEAVRAEMSTMALFISDMANAVGIERLNVSGTVRAKLQELIVLMRKEGKQLELGEAH